MHNEIKSTSQEVLFAFFDGSLVCKKWGICHGCYLPGEFLEILAF